MWSAVILVVAINGQAALGHPSNERKSNNS